MKVVISLFLLLFFSVCVNAQTEKDSMYLFDYQKEIYKKNFLLHNLSSALNFGEISLDYLKSEGNRRLAQQAQTNQRVDFYAIGANQLGNFRISGDFLFNKVFEDSLSYGQRNDIDEWSTFNYYASKAGKYERQNYKANVTLSYKVNRFLQPFFNVNYHNHWTTGSVDPRFESKKFEMKYNLGLVIHLKESSLSLKAILGRGKENTGVSYKNRNYGQSLLYPDRIHYLNLGYGFNSIKDTANTRKYSDIVGTELAFSTKFGRAILDLDASVERKNEDNTNDLKSTSVYKKRATFEQSTYVLNTTLQLLGINSHHLIVLDGKHVTGEDGLINFSSTFDKVNYTVDYSEAKVGYLFTNNKGREWNYDLGLNFSYFSINRKDFSSFLDVSNSFVHISPKFNIRKRLSNGDFAQLGFNPKLILDVDHAIQYSVNSMNNYIEGVVFWDYDYYRSNALTLKWTAQWITSRVSSQYLMGVRANYSLERNLSNSNMVALSDFQPDAKRNFFSISLFLNL